MKIEVRSIDLASKDWGHGKSSGLFAVCIACSMDITTLIIGGFCLDAILSRY
ncbi:hypothetical protein V4762_03855 [Thermodesulfobium sp. 4217-1]|uniref:hypothetical protein n=1 Tax=Thermodesulfobium sp. 4217-1 TaxID=3120013 RepID=UPI0032218D0E